MQPNYYGNMYNAYPQAYGQQVSRYNSRIDYFVVSTEEEARRYILNVGQTVIFKVAEKNIMLERSLDMNGNSSTNYYELRTNTPKQEYVTRPEFDELVTQFKKLAEGTLNEQH